MSDRFLNPDKLASIVQNNNRTHFVCKSPDGEVRYDKVGKNTVSAMYQEYFLKRLMWEPSGYNAEFGQFKDFITNTSQSLTINTPTPGVLCFNTNSVTMANGYNGYAGVDRALTGSAAQMLIGTTVSAAGNFYFSGTAQLNENNSMNMFQMGQAYHNATADPDYNNGGFIVPWFIQTLSSPFAYSSGDTISCTWTVSWT